MRVLFAYDHKFLISGQHVYTCSQFTAAFWQRYLTYCTSVTVLARSVGQEDVDLSRYQKSNCENIDFIFKPSISSIYGKIVQRKRVHKDILQIVDQVDFVLARLPSEFGLLAISAAKELKVPWGVELVGCPRDSFLNHGSIAGKLYAPIAEFETKRALRDAPVALYVTNNFLQERYPNYAGKMVACSDVKITTADFSVVQRRLDRWNSGDFSKRFVIGLIGTLSTRYKGIDTVLRAIKLVRQQIPQVVFRVLGPGDTTGWVAEAKELGVSEFVRFDGVLPHGEPVFSWLDDIDLYLQPSRVEGMPRALIEAMSRGCPAIASSCGGMPDLLDNEYLIKPGDYIDLAGKILRSIDEPLRMARQVQRNWEVSKSYEEKVLDTSRHEFFMEMKRLSEVGIG